MILLISSGFTDKLCKATDVYQRIQPTRVGGVGRTGGEGGGGKKEREGEGGKKREVER